MEKIWLKNYEPGVPETIDPDRYTSLTQLIEEQLSKFTDKPCYYNLGTMLTYGELDKLSLAFAHFLQETCQISRGDRVALMLPNVLQYPVALFGILRAAGVVVNVNPLYTARELKHVLQDSGAKCLVVLSNFAHVVEEVLPQTKVQYVIVSDIGDLLGTLKGFIVNYVVKHVKKMVPAWDLPQAFSFKHALSSVHMVPFEKPLITREDIAFLQYTGGTTGISKGAILTHRNMVANILQADAWIVNLLKQQHTAIITALPLYHIFSLTANCLVFLRAGIPNILITNPRDIPGFVKELKRQPFSILTGVNTLFNALLNNEAFCQLDFSQFKLALGGGMAVQKGVAQRWQQVTGTPLIEAYGLTETSPAVTINPLNLTHYNGSIGLPIPSTEVKICDEENQEVALGQSGELYVKGPQVMKGYWNNPQETAQVLTADGWLRTGDIVTMDEGGFIHLIDRKKDIIIVSGFNVYPNEVEDVIAQMLEVKEVAVIGVDSPEHGELVKAFIVKRDPNLTVEQVLAFCHEQLTRYKVPHEIEFREQLPKTNVGKILRRALREEEKAKWSRNA